jgi:hypothetical protein
MSGLEGIVRPFQRPTSLTPRRLIASNTKIDVSPATITWGQAGTLPEPVQVEAVDQTGTNFQVVNAQETFTEVSRQNDTVRVSDPTGSGSFLDVERPYQMTYSKASVFQPGRNVTQTWSNAFETAGFSTVNFNNQGSRSTFNLSRNLS